MTRPALAFSLRLSRAADESSSLDVQLRACAAKAQSLGFSAEQIAAAQSSAYVDDGVSGGSALESRKGMSRVMADCPETVIAWKLDRFARSVGEFDKLLRWADENGVRLVTSDSLLDSADKSGTGRMVAQIIAVVAAWELGIITERSEAAHAERREQGRWISGKAPWPYRMERRDGKAYLAEDADAFEQCRSAVADLLDGGTLASTAESLPIGRYQWRKLLRGVVLRGWREHKGQLVCEADGVTPVSFGPEVIDAATAQRVKARLAELAAGERAERRDAPWLAGMVVCHCGAAYNGGMSSRKRQLYKCADGCGSIMADRIEPAVERAFLREYGATPLEEITYSGGIDNSAEIADLEAMIARGNANLLLMDPETAHGLRALVEEKETLAARLRAEHAPEVVEHRRDTGEDLYDAWEGASEAMRRTLLLGHGLRVTVAPRTAVERLSIKWEV